MNIASDIEKKEKTRRAESDSRHLGRGLDSEACEVDEQVSGVYEDDWRDDLATHVSGKWLTTNMN